MRQHLEIFIVLFFLIICGCGLDESDNSSSQRSVNVDGVTNSIHSASPQLLHEMGIETFALGVGSDDPAAIAQSISLLEQAALAVPDVDTYWLDLADAYMGSGNVLQYPYAIEIYWMLYKEGTSQKDALLTRLIESYCRVGNFAAAFDTALIRLSNADDKHVDPAALHLAMISLNNGAFEKAIDALNKKAGSTKNPTYLKLLAASLQEVSGDNEASVKLLDKILENQKNKAFFTSITQAKQRMNP